MHFISSERYWPGSATSKSQMRLSRKISQMGFNVADEMFFPPYTVDIVLVDYHLGIECDKYWTHKIKSGRIKDAHRRGYLLETYGLPILSISGHKNIVQKVTEYISLWVDDVEERRQKYIEAYCKLI